MAEPNTDLKAQFSKIMTFFMIFAVIITIIIYINVEGGKKNKCPELPSKSAIISVYDNTNIPLTTPISQLYIMTAYNCCCLGKFKNDYVNGDNTNIQQKFCALQNCALQGVRALDFTVYLQKGVPVISASTTNDNNYKEMYNSVDFNNTMVNVKRYFLLDTNSSTVKDPLFLIFRIYSDKQETYNLVATTLNEIFGVNNEYGNFIYTKTYNKTITLKDIQNSRVVIMIEPFSTNLLNNSQLNLITSVTLDPTGKTYPSIKRLVDIKSNTSNNLVLLYPDFDNNSSNNYDSKLNGFRNKISFTAMNFQNKDYNLTTYTKQFNGQSFIIFPTE